MLAYTLSRPRVKLEIRPAVTPNTSPIVTPDVTISVEDEDDGIDFSRVRAELDRLLEEGLRESDDDVVDETQDSNTIDVYYEADHASTAMKNNADAMIHLQLGDSAPYR